MIGARSIRVRGVVQGVGFRPPGRHSRARELVTKRVRPFATRSVGRLAALPGFIRELTFEGQAAIGLGHWARGAAATVALPGGVFQQLKEIAAEIKLPVWTNCAVPPNDGGISLGQASLACFQEVRHA